MGLGLITAGLADQRTMSTGALLAGAGAELPLSGQMHLGVHLQYKQPLTNLVRTTSLQRDGFVIARLDLKYFFMQTRPAFDDAENRLIAIKNQE